MVMVILIAGLVLGVIQVILQMEINGAIDYPLLYGIIAIEAVVVVAVIITTRKREVQLGDMAQRLASRTAQDGSAGHGWILKVFDNGLVMQAQASGSLVSMYICYTEDLKRYAPAMAEIMVYMKGTGVMRRVQYISRRKGDPSARASLELLRQQLGMRWAVLALLKRRPEKRPEIKSPAWLVGFSSYWPKWSTRGDALMSEIDIVVGLLESASRNYFGAIMGAG
jgi:hypothetical protein